jgi:lipoate-protein ligase B
VSDLLVCHLGRVPYEEGVEIQERLRSRVQEGELGEVLLLLEHDPVYTLGRRSEPGDLGLGEDWCRAQGIDVVKTQRGGKLTYHGPGQLVGYPIMRVGDVPAFVAAMEGAIVEALGEAGVTARPRSHEGREWTGVWVDDRKIASIGIHVSRGVSAHGFAVNVDNDLAPFTWVVACGLPSVAMTSVAQEGSPEGVACFRKRMAYRFAQAFGRRQRLISPERLGIPPAPPARPRRAPAVGAGAPTALGTLDA